MLSGRWACPIEDWIGRRCRGRETSIIAHISRLGTKRIGDWRLRVSGGRCTEEKCWGMGTRV